MKLLLQVRPTNGTADFAYLPLTRELANWLLDHRETFLKALRHPVLPAHWLTVQDPNAIQLFQTGGRCAEWQQHRQALDSTGWVILDEHFDIERIVADFKPIAVNRERTGIVLTESGVSWHCKADYTTWSIAPIPYNMVEEAAGIPAPPAEVTPTGQ